MSARVVAIIGAVAVALIIIAYNTFFTVDPREQAIVLRFGEPFEVAHGDRKALAKRLGDEVRRMAAEMANGRMRHHGAQGAGL